MKKILTLTMNPCIDKNTTIDRVVAEQKLRCSTVTNEPGGGGINVSRAIKKLGGESLALYPKGGSLGDSLQKLLQDEDINQEPVLIRESTRESFIVFENSTRLQYRFSLPGPCLEEAEWRSILDRIRDLSAGAEYIVASGRLPRGVPDDFYAHVSRIAKEQEAKMILDASGDFFPRAFPGGKVFLIKPNLRELSHLAWDRMKDESYYETAAAEIVKMGLSDVVVVSLGAGGAFLSSKDMSEHISAPTVPIKSKVGAGDSMVAGIIQSLARGADLKEAVRFGVAAGAAAVMTEGTQLCRKDDTEKLYNVVKKLNS